MKKYLIYLIFITSEVRTIIKDQGIETLDEFKILLDQEVVYLYKLEKYPGGTIDTINQYILNPRVNISIREENN